MRDQVETARTSEARMALHGPLIEASPYDDSNAFDRKYCAKITGPIQSIEIVFTVRKDVIPEDTLVLRVGKERL